MTMLKKGILATTIAASALVSTMTPAMARDYYRSHDNTAAVAIGVGIMGLAVGAIAASSNNDDRRYRDGRYYEPRARVNGYRYYRNDDYNRSRNYEPRGGWDDRQGYGNDHSEGWNDRYYSRRGY